MDTRKRLTISFFALVLVIGYYSMGAAPVKSDDAYSYHGDTEWHTNVTEAKEVAADQGKPVLVYYWTTWCTYCKDYNEKVYSSQAVQNRLDEFVLLAVNLDSDQEAAVRIKNRYDADYPPQHVVITPDGQQVSKLPGYTPKDEFMTYLERSQQRYQQ